MNNIIEIKNLSKQFKEHTVLKDVTLNFGKGKIYGLVGRNGSGKTVLMKCICGLIPPSTGEIIVNDKVIGRDMDIAENVGIIIESPGFLPNYSGFNNLKLLSMIKNKINNDEIKAVIKKVGLDPGSKKHVGKYSLGMRQRLGLAQAIMEDPDIYT